MQVDIFYIKIHYAIFHSCLLLFKDIYEDTEWNDQLRKRGIIPPKEKGITEEQIVDIVERTVQEKLNRGKF